MTLSLSRLAKTYGKGAPALHTTDLKIAEGEILALLGPSGCGKTTLLRLIAGLEAPDPGGTIRFGSEDVTRRPVERRQVGMVFQSYALFPNMSVRGNIAYGLKLQRLPRVEIAARVAELLRLCQLVALADRPVTALSGGQRQRVALARAMAPRPRVLLLDEPLSALDASLRDSLRDELALLLRSFGTTAIFVTHDQAEAMAIADRVAVMQAGRIVQLASPEDLYRSPASAFAARFVGGAMDLGGQRDGDELVLPGGRLRVGTTPGPVLVRAEDIRLDPEGSLKARVEQSAFLGGYYRLTLSGLAEGPLHAHHQGRDAPRVGEIVRIYIAPEALLILSEDPSA